MWAAARGSHEERLGDLCNAAKYGGRIIEVTGAQKSVYRDDFQESASWFCCVVQDSAYFRSGYSGRSGFCGAALLASSVSCCVR
jgi:hypothetical protein